ncbi:pantoate--beta-alanine ligase [Rhodoluna sp.]|uniref:pantoate--beta-alanine ligase n=1 Tax=Rhodoluna sp. TaxID=1969481 RepID=UPI0025D3882D|nr:pantoate--beta-alanine ligase [Rhodoluna sp.]
MITAKTGEALAAAVGAAKAAGKKVGFVPTMGALHEGHLSLIAEAKKHADFIVVSIFVNPLQFGAGEDFEKYPRTIDADSALLQSAAADLLFLPTVNDVYQGNTEITQQAGHIGELFEGASRPGHFDGMLTVVARLFELVQPDIAVFGAKDAQQVFLVRQMAAKQFAKLRIIEAPTLREPSGLALSSRNRYLSQHEHAVATQLSAALRVGHATATSPSAALESARTVMHKVPEAKLDYIALVDANSFEAIQDGFKGRALMLIAAVVGTTRLIDNIEIVF